MKQLSYIVFGMFYLAFVTEINSLKIVPQKQIGKVLLKRALILHRQVFTSSNDAKQVERDTLYRLMPDGHRDMVVKRGLPGALVSDGRKKPLGKAGVLVSNRQKRSLYVAGDDSVYGTANLPDGRRQRVDYTKEHNGG